MLYKEAEEAKIGATGSTMQRSGPVDAAFPNRGGSRVLHLEGYYVGGRMHREPMRKDGASKAGPRAKHVH